nr:class I SAM-dependent methyltransferase [Brevibacterium daeguense]
MRSHSWRTAQRCAPDLLARLDSGMHILDIGSGVGTITCDLAEAVERVTAVEVGEDSARLTREEAQRRGRDNIEVEIADCHELPFEDGEFDAVHIHQVLQHVADPRRALAEAVRVVRSGSLVSVTESDYGGFRWHPQAPGLGRWLALYRATARRNGGEPDAGIHLRAWVADLPEQPAGVEYLSRPWVFATPEDCGWWGDTWADRISRSKLAADVVGFGLADASELEGIAASWRGWSAHPDAWFTVAHSTALITR